MSLSSGTPFLLTMSDATGIWFGWDDKQFNCWNSVTNNQCNTATSSPPYTFALTPNGQQLTQCEQFTVTVGSGAVLPVTITQLIPGGQAVVFNPVNSLTFTSVVDVNAATNLLVEQFLVPKLQLAVIHCRDVSHGHGFTDI
ncbi:hypothetical protein EDB19DRAFT_2043183 [Suillus lakei]|nr:hypothetical protein EDB19DRAFT_2043183 [Suillus lakei]